MSLNQTRFFLVIILLALCCCSKEDKFIQSKGIQQEKAANVYAEQYPKNKDYTKNVPPKSRELIHKYGDCANRSTDELTSEQLADLALAHGLMHNDYEESICLQRALDKDPDNRMTYDLLAMNYANNGQCQEAVQLLEKGYNKTKDPILLNTMATIYCGMRNPTKLLETLRRLDRLDKSSAKQVYDLCTNGYEAELSLGNSNFIPFSRCSSPRD